MIGQDNRFKKIVNLLPQTHKIRNVSIVAHVDHGKTTIADCLIASNGIIHKKQAGQLRLLDDRFDEQDRGITMKSSSISLVFQDNLINLIDSPGHLEFYSEVSSALRLTDAALLVVDVVEGLSSQTYRVLRELYDQKLSSILVLNKVDKLILHCKMDPMEAYTHINQIIEQVNAVLGSFISKELISQKRENKDEKIQDTKEFEQLENKFFFSTEMRNIIFSSALDNWGFTTDCFAPLIAKKLNKKPQDIAKYLWGDYYFNSKTKQFSEEPRNQNDRPVCVDLVLKPIWDIFENVLSENKERIQKIIAALGLKISQNTKKHYNNLLIREIMNAWLPFDVITLKRIIEVLPDPVSAQNFRLPYLLGLENQEAAVSQQIKKALSKCSFENEAPVIAFISKMVNIAKGNFNERGLNELKSQDPATKTLGFGRIFSGKMKRGESIYVIGAKKKKVKNQQGQLIEVPDIEKVQINNLYVFNGQYPDGITEAYAGNIVGIGNLDDQIYKSGTISTQQNCISFVPVNLQSKSVLKVSISTPNIQDNNKLLDGLKKLNKSDPSVEVYISNTGDLILNTSGQVHLEKCIVDLEKIFCKIPIKTSDPIISFRETIIWTKLDENKNEKYIEEQIKKQKEKQRKILLQKFKQERVNDAQVDQQEKQKQKAIREWDSHVEIYQSSDLTVEDTRFFFKDYEQEDESKYSYKQQKEYKKIDHKNKGKQHIKQKFLNLGLKTNVNKQLTPNQFLWLKVKAIGYSFEVVEHLQKELDRMKKIFSLDEQKKGNIFADKYNQERIEFMQELFEKLKEHNTDENVINLLKDNMVCFGPNYIGSNFLVFKNMDTKFSLYNKIMDKNEEQLPNHTCLKLGEDVLKILEEYKLTIAELENSIRLGFDIACTSGPLCNEPMVGVIFILEDIIRADVVQPQPKAQVSSQTKNESKSETKQQNEQTKQEKLQTPTKPKQTQNVENKNFTDSFGPLAGQIMSAMKDTCVQAFLGGSPRLVEPMYYCELQTDQQFYGNVYNELSKRRAVVISEDLHQISNFFIIKAYLPVVQSQRFCFNLQDNSKGTVNAQLRLDTWKIHNEDPFFVPLTEEEIEQNGVDNVLYNAARILLDKIRAKKGMSTTEKIVVAAEKQRNLKKK